MNQIKLKTYHEAHLDLFELFANDDIDILKKNTCYKITDNDEAYTILIDNKPIFALGCRIINDIVAECWLIRTIHAINYKKFVVETTKKLLEEFCKDNNIKRVQTLIKEPYIRWIEFMRFERECELKGFAKDKTYLYRRLM